MAKLISKYICQQCGYESTKWMGKCPDCGTWNSFVESVVETKSGSKNKRSGSVVITPQNLTEVKLSKTPRTSTKISELDRVLGGGIVNGQVTLIAGEPGIGKSTILLQVADNMGKILYVSGEESATQIKLRAERLGIKSKDIQLMESTDIDSIVETAESIKSDLGLLIVDSIQTVSTSDLTGLAGSVGQVRESAFRLVKFAKANGIPVIVVGHVTKQGSVAGPSVLAHIVDTVVWFEGDKNLQYRLLRAMKNRFGSTDEVGIFTMEEKGLMCVEETSKMFLSDERKNVAGSVTTSIMEGTRPILIEVQSLVVTSKLAFPKRVAQGVDSKRIELILAILQRRAGIPVGDYDVYVNVVGGIVVKDPSADLAIALSVASSYFDKPVSKNTVAVGEVDLLGDIRPIRGIEKIVKDAKRQGFSNIVSNTDFKYLTDAIKALLL
ncbi:MAG: DNA repair protein RadA [Patescibacteria group bacterium]